MQFNMSAVRFGQATVMMLSLLALSTHAATSETRGQDKIGLRPLRR